MQVTVHCPSCEGVLPVDVREGLDQIKCGRCGRIVPLAVTPAVREDRGVDSCPLCSGREFYMRKDFDPHTGLTVVIIGALVSATFYWFGLDLVAYGVLAVAVLIDLIVYRRLSDVTVCYRCHTEFRGAYERAAQAFDLHIADALEQEYERRIGKR